LDKGGDGDLIQEKAISSHQKISLSMQKRRWEKMRISSANNKHENIENCNHVEALQSWILIQQHIESKHQVLLCQNSADGV